MFKKNKLIFLTAFVFFGALLILSLNKNYFYPSNNQAVNTAANQEISLEFSFDKDEVLKLKYPYQKDISVLNITEEIARNKAWEFASKDYGEMGFLITQIKDKTNGQANNYWHYNINDVLAPVAADKYILQTDDTLSWSFQTSDMTTK